jgi:hypothetical protein
VSSGHILVRFFAGLAAGLAAVLLVLGSATGRPSTAGAAVPAASRHGSVEPRLAHIASLLAGKAVDLRCSSRSSWSRMTQGLALLGLADIGGRRIDLSPDVCAGLTDLVHGARPTDERSLLLLAAAVVTLSHEPQHSKGIAVEAVAECNAIQLAPATALRLGVSSSYARLLIRTYWAHYAEEPPAYQSPECRRGGALDLGLAGSIWP